MSDEPSNKLAVLVHHNNEVTILDERGLPRLCRDCRFSGWLTAWERGGTFPRTCLLFSGGADTRDGDRVIYDNVDDQYDHNSCARKTRNRYPMCDQKNPDGKCKDYVKAKPLPWLGNFWKKLFRREWRTRKMRE